MKLSEYDYTIIYKKGKYNTKADALSRVQLNNEEIESLFKECGIDTSLIPEPPGSSTATIHTSAEDPILELPITDEALNKFHRQICFTTFR